MQLMSSPCVIKHETDSGRKLAYYAAILSGKNDRGLWSLSTVEQFASSFLKTNFLHFLVALLLAMLLVSLVPRLPHSGMQTLKLESLVIFLM